jgi:PAS domain S-box-containing protein
MTDPELRLGADSSRPAAYLGEGTQGVDPRDPRRTMRLLFSRRSKSFSLIAAGVLVALIALIDWRVVDDVPLGFLYLLPMLILGKMLQPWQTALAAALCTYLTEEFDQFAWNLRTGLPRDVLYFMAFFSIGMFVYETTRNRQIVLRQLHEIEEQSYARRDAEEQLTVLVESSPAAIITADSDGTVLMANEAAHRMLAVKAPGLLGRSIHRYFPSLSNVSGRETSQHLFRTVMQSRGQRDDGEGFLAEICFSTYHTHSGPRLAAMILDSSEEFRTREESSLHQMLAGSRIAVGAVSHEIRNVCGAIAVVHRNLSRGRELTQDKDFEALGNLVVALERIAAVDLRPYPEQTMEVDLLAMLDDLRIVIAPSLQDKGIQCAWKLDPELPLVWADGTNLMQVFLNLTTNSIRTLTEKESGRSLTISAGSDGQRVTVEVLDNGGGVAQPADLFHPFQTGARNTGLGLYLARAFARSFGGDLRYKAIPGCACFVVELAPVR